MPALAGSRGICGDDGIGDIAGLALNLRIQFGGVLRSMLVVHFDAKERSMPQPPNNDLQAYAGGFKKSLLLIAVSLLALSLPAIAQEASAGNAGGPAGVDELKKELAVALDRLNEIQQELDAHQQSENLQQQISAERQRLEAIEQRLDQTSSGSQTATPLGSGIEPPGATAPTSRLTPADIYHGGFFVETADKSYSLIVNGLVQIRYTGFKPANTVQALGESSQGTNNFDVFLGRLALSGSVFEPNLKYFLQFQGSTVGNSNTVTMLDWFTSKTISNHLTLQAGRSWTPYTYEFYLNPGNYLFPDLSTAEYAFVLPRTVGFQAYGDAGRVSYAFMIANSVLALDASGQENFDTRLAYIGHVQFNLLAPYGYVETDPAGAARPELTLWTSAAYNPISSGSGFENVTAKDTTVNATMTVGFRYRYFVLQPTGYYRKTNPAAGGSPFNSWGYGEQSGLYLIPHKLEFGERVSGVNWGSPDYDAGAPVVTGSSLPIENAWFVGPPFSFHRVQEDSGGLNYYVHSHNAKIQMEYSYLHGNTFADKSFFANRVWIQAQIMF